METKGEQRKLDNKRVLISRYRREDEAKEGKYEDLQEQTQGGGRDTWEAKRAREIEDGRKGEVYVSLLLLSLLLLCLFLF